MRYEVRGGGERQEAETLIGAFDLLFGFSHKYLDQEIQLIDHDAGRVLATGRGGVVVTALRGAQMSDLEQAAVEVVAAHRALIAYVTPPGRFDREEYDALFSKWHAATRKLNEVLGYASYGVTPAKPGRAWDR